jgi:hypothetical protein
VLRLLACLALAAGGSACSSTWEQRAEPAQRAFYRGDVSSAIRLLEHRLKQVRGSADEGVVRLDLAMALQADGQYARAAQQLIAADHELEVLEYSRAPLEVLSAALFATDRGAYHASRPEKLLVNVQNVLNFLGAGDWESAAVEARRARVLLLQPDLPESERYPSRLAWGLAGIAFELAGRPAEADDAYREAGVPGLDARPGPGEGTVLVVVQNGKAPVRVQAEYRLWADGLLHRLQLPALVTRSSGFARARVSLDEREEGDAQVLVDIAEQSAVRYADQFPRLVAAAALAVVPRALAAHAVERKLRDEDEPDDSLRNVLAKFLGFLTGEALAESLPSDTRAWTLLPADVRVLRLAVPAGAHLVSVDLLGGAKARRMQWTVTVDAGGFALVNAVTATVEGWHALPEPRSTDLTLTPAGLRALELLEAALAVREAGQAD